jgi:Ca2+-binding RTX toxin-like protein
VPAYAFESITIAQARAYNAATDSLTFGNEISARSTSFDFNPDGTVLVSAPGRSETFGPGIHGETDFIFSNGSRVILGTFGNDLLVGGSKDDALFGGPGDDTLAGGGGSDLLFGGSGADLYLATSQNARGAVDYVRGWETIDRLALGHTDGQASNYTEFASGGLAQDIYSAGAGGRYVASAAGAPLFWVSVGTNNGQGIELTDVMILENRGAADIDFRNIVARPNVVLPAPPPVQVFTPDPFSPTAPTPGTRVGLPATSASIVGNMDTANFADLDGAEIFESSATRIDISKEGIRFVVTGVDFRYSLEGDLTGGRVTDLYFQRSFVERYFQLTFRVHTDAIPPPASELLGGATQQVFGLFFAGNDNINGTSALANGALRGADLLRGYDGADIIAGNGGDDTIFGGAGDDVIYAVSSGPPPNPVTGTTYLRGEDGADFIVGGTGFDDAHGNAGNDTVVTGAGDDYCVGGKDNDLLFGEAGADLVYGNLGADSCDGGDGNDIIRGGQDNDIVRGGAGNDYVSGDRGDDTMTGGAGADIFHSFGESGLDRITDFSLAQGDRVQLDPGTTYSLSQVGADTVISMTGGGQVILVGVSMSSLTGAWITVG